MDFVLGYLQPVFVPLLPQWAVWVALAAGEHSVADGGAAVHHHHLVHRVIHDLLHLNKVSSDKLRRRGGFSTWGISYM